MIELYSHGSPNGHKISIALEEMRLSYEIKTVDVFAGAGQAPEFLKLNPAGRIPVIRDTEADLVLTESNAILIYLADKARAFLPREGRERLRAIELLFLQASLVGPMFGQRSHFSLFAVETVPYGVRRYEEQGEQINAIVDTLLQGRDYFLPSGYSIVDMSFVGWYHAAVKTFSVQHHKNLQTWLDRVLARPAVQKGVTLPSMLPNLPSRKQL